MARWAFPILDGLAVATAAAAVLPFLPLLPIHPTTMDGGLWVSRGAITSDGWLDWDLFGNHFIGYRPVTALTFTLDSVLGGLSPPVYHLTDVGLYACTALAVYAAAIQLLGPRSPQDQAARDRASRGCALLAMVLFLLHPAVEEIIPYFSRRSYVLTALFSSLSVAMVPRAARLARPTSGPALAVGGLTALSLLSNEEGYILLPTLPLLSLVFSAPGPQRLKRALAPCLPALVAGALALALKLAITRELGGYGHGLPDGAQVLRILDRAWTHVFFPPSARNEPNPVGAGGWAALVLGIWLVFSTSSSLLGSLFSGFTPMNARKPLQDTDLRGALPLVLAIWLSGYVFLSLATSAWYSRQAWPALVPMVLLVATLVRGHLEARWSRALFLVAPLAVLPLSLAWYSPLLHGLDPFRHESFLAYQSRVDALVRDLAPLPRERALVYLVTPIDEVAGWDAGGGSQIWYHGQRTSSWARTLLGRRGLRIQDIGFLTVKRGSNGTVRMEVLQGRPAFVFPPNARMYAPRGRFRPAMDRLPTGEGVLWLDTLPQGGDARRYLYFFQGSAGVLQEVPPPS